jgi:hypothetical protein
LLRREEKAVTRSGMSNRSQADLPVYRVLPYEMMNISAGSCASCGEQFTLANLHNTDVKHRLVLSCTSCGDLALFDVLSG